MDRRQALAILAVTGLWTLTPWPATAFTTDRIVTDPRTGLALGGYDPVAYFVDRKPRIGSRAHEFVHAGTVWRFANVGNLAAFRAHPEVYRPRFGGYDPYAIAIGAPAEGDPLLFEIHDERLYLFFAPAHRAAFRLVPDRTVRDAEANWPAVRESLAR